ncbi:MAG: response regulator transcription factor [Lachnospiraceae bacterium]|nr:response regulator transcription factor [Lachnospiraceae bacterium]
MLRIAICDDEESQTTQVHHLLKTYCTLHPERNLQTETFTSGRTLLEHLRTDGNFDIYLLDVLMPYSNGIELGLKIRDVDSGAHIIYLTSSPDYAVDSYLVKASQYLLKPVEKERFFSILDDSIAALTKDRHSYILVKTRDGFHRLAVHSIVYGELVGHCIQYHLKDGQVVSGMSVRTSFRKAVGHILENDCFALCATSFFVNLNYVEMIESASLKLSDGKLLPLSRTMRNEVTNRWFDHHLKGGLNV